MLSSLPFATAFLSKFLCPDRHPRGPGCFHAGGIAIATVFLLPGKAGNPAVQCAENVKKGHIALHFNTHAQDACVHMRTSPPRPFLKDIAMRSLRQIKVLTPDNTQLVLRQKRGKPRYKKVLLLLSQQKIINSQGIFNVRFLKSESNYIFLLVRLQTQKNVIKLFYSKT
jgi:hypothetical protein